jgi:hypothetical protein
VSETDCASAPESTSTPSWACCAAEEFSRSGAACSVGVGLLQGFGVCGELFFEVEGWVGDESSLEDDGRGGVDLGGMFAEIVVTDLVESLGRFVMMKLSSGRSLMELHFGNWFGKINQLTYKGNCEAISTEIEKPCRMYNGP